MTHPVDNIAEIVIGPMRVGSTDAIIRTNSPDFAAAAQWTFADLMVGEESSAKSNVVFDTFEHHDTSGPAARWSVHRDGEPCELELRPDAVLVHQQWELNQLAIESQPASIHAAAVALDGRGVLLIGKSHSGKTSLAGWLAARHGAVYLTDEVASVDASGCVAPFPRPLGVRPASPLAQIPFGPSADGHSDSAGGAAAAARFMPDERLVPVTALGGSVHRTPVPVSLLILPTYDASSTLKVTALSIADAFERLASVTPGLAGHGQQVFGVLSRLVEQAPTIEIRHADVRAAAAAVHAAVGDLAPVEQPGADA